MSTGGLQTGQPVRLAVETPTGWRIVTGAVVAPVDDLCADWVPATSKYWYGHDIGEIAIQESGGTEAAFAWLKIGGEIVESRPAKTRQHLTRTAIENLETAIETMNDRLATQEEKLVLKAAMAITQATIDFLEEYYE